MAKKKKRGNSFLFYTLILLNIAASALAVYGLSGQWRIQEESKATYEELQQSVAAQSEALLLGEQASAQEETYVSQGMEEEEADQDATMWLIQQNQPQASAPDVIASPEVSQAPQPGSSVTDIESAPQPDASLAPNLSPTPSAQGSWGATQVAESTLAPELAPNTTVDALMERAVQVDEAHYSLDFTYLRSVYPQIKAWLFQEGTNVNYPVMQAEDNEYYLDHLYNGKINKHGSIFLDCGNSGELIDANNYIYGHKTKTGEMFGVLHKYQEQAYFDAHPQMTLFTPYSDFCIDIFASTMSLVEDESSWRLKQFKSKAEFDEYIAGIKEQSFFKTDVTPEWGDQLLVLCTCTNVSREERYVVYGRMRPIRYGTEEAIALTKKDMDERPTESGKRQVEPLGELQLYALNDDLWKNFRYEARNSKKSRKFGDGGGGTTAVAMVVANLVPLEELPRMLGYARATTGFTFCTHSVNQYFCNKLHAQYQIQTSEEFLRYLPIAIASFTTGNNIWDNQARSANKNGTDMSFLPYIASIYGLELNTSIVLGDALRTLEDGGMVVCLSGGKYSPFSNANQYVVLAGMDDQYLYILDPNLRSSYDKVDTDQRLEIVTPGAVRVKLENIDKIGLNSYYLLQKGQP